MVGISFTEIRFFRRRKLTITIFKFVINVIVILKFYQHQAFQARFGAGSMLFLGKNSRHKQKIYKKRSKNTNMILLCFFCRFLFFFLFFQTKKTKKGKKERKLSFLCFDVFFFLSFCFSKKNLDLNLPPHSTHLISTTGNDIPAKVIKSCKNSLAKALTLLWKDSFDTSIIPQCFKDQTIVPNLFQKITTQYHGLPMSSRSMKELCERDLSNT